MLTFMMFRAISVICFQFLKAIFPSFKPNLSKIERRSFTFGWPFDIKTCTPTFAMVQAIWTPSSPTLVKMNSVVSLLSNFSELKFDHRFGCPCTPTFTTFWPIFSPFNPNLSKTTYLEDKSARKLSWCSELFSTPLSQTLTKPHDGVSLLTNF